jgi:plastocyanin
MKALVMVSALAILLAAAPAQSAEQTVGISEYAFSPAKLSVTAGTKVTWINHDQVPHSVVEKDKRFHSAALDTDDSYSLTFSQPGTFQYFCSLHPRMTGTVTVVAGR